MAAFARFEDIEPWQGARSLTTAVYSVTSDGAWAKDFGLRDQIRRASVSIMSNIAEGFARETDVEFHRFLVIARGSAAEVKAQMYVAADLGYVAQETFSDLLERIDRIARQLTGLMKYLKK